MAKRLSIPSKYVQLKIVGPENSFLVSRVQRLTSNADQPTNTIDELGNSQHAGSSKDIPNVTTTFQLMDVGIKAVAVMTGTDAESYPAAGVDLGTDFAKLDAIINVRDEDVSDYVKAGHLRRLVVQSFSFNYTVDGDSTEEYTLIGSTKRWFTNDVVVDRFTTGTTSFTLNSTPITLKNGNEALSVILDGTYLTEVASGPSSGEYSISGTTLTTGDTRTGEVMVIYQAAPAGTNWTDVSETVMPAAIRGKDVDINILASGISRVQSLTINGNFNPQAVREMGNRQVVGYTEQVPEITGTITVLDTDTELIELFTTGQRNSGDTEFPIGQCGASGVPLEVILRNPADCDEPFAALKTVYLDEVSITSEGFTSNVNDNAQQTFDWRSDTASLIVYSGARP